MKADISLEKKARYLSLLLGVLAITEPFTHERNELTFTSDDGRYAFRIRTDVNYVAFGPVGEMESPPFWTANISNGDIQRLFCNFLWAQYDELQAFAWASKEP